MSHRIATKAMSAAGAWSSRPTARATMRTSRPTAVSGSSHGAVASASQWSTSEEPYRNASGIASCPTNVRAHTNGSAATDSVCRPRASPLPRKLLMTLGNAQAETTTTAAAAATAARAPRSQVRCGRASAITAGHTLSPPPTARIAPAAVGTASASTPAIANRVGIAS